MSKPRSRLFLLDTFGLIYRAFYGRSRAGLQALRTSDDFPTEAIYIFNNMLKRILEDYSPEYLVAVWEGSGDTFREKVFPEYKANRERMPESLTAQLPYILRLLKAWNILTLSEDGYEADDTIGLLTSQGLAQDMDVYVISSDKDLMQLVKQGVFMLNPMKKQIYQEQEVEKFLGVKPEQVTDLLALKGDAVDNIPGAPGIGEKGACQLISEYGGIERIIENADSVSNKKYRESLQNNADLIRLSKRLATLDTTGTLQLDLENVKVQLPDKSELSKLYKELELFSLNNQLEGSDDDEKVDYKIFESVKQFEDWLALSDEPITLCCPAFDDSKQMGLTIDKEHGIGLSSGEKDVWLLPGNLMLHTGKGLEDCGRDFWVHDWKSAIHELNKFGIRLSCVTDDTMLMAFMLDSTRSEHALGRTIVRRLGIAWDGNPARGAFYTQKLRNLLSTSIKNPELRSLYETVELPLMPVIARMEQTGIMLDKKKLAELSWHLQLEIGRLGSEIYALADKQFNINSPKQLGEVLYKKLGVPEPPLRGKSKSPSTASDVLQEFTAEFPIVSKVLSWRFHTKLKNTFVDVLPALVQSDGRLHTTFNPTGSATGRLSSLNPNLQNIPIRQEVGRMIRTAFVTEPGWKLLAADYSQIELRILAHMSKDPKLVEAFKSNEDIHVRTASEVFGLKIKEVNSDQRRRAKAVNFGIVYGLSPFGLAKQLNISQHSAKQYIDLYFKQYSAVKDLLASLIETAKKTGYSSTLLGRQRPITDLESKSSTARGYAERIAINSPLQGTTADLIKKAMVSVDQLLRKGGFKARMLLQVHDELLLEAPDDEVEAVGQLVKHEMDSVVNLDVPLVTDLKSGLNWNEMQPMQ